MIAQRWMTWFSHLGSRRAARPAASSLARHGLRPSMATQHVDVGDVPVFDHRQKQVGFIPAPPDITGAVEINPAQWMSHCLNDAVSWTLQDSDDGEITRLIGALGLRVPLVNPSQQICGIVVLEASIRPGQIVTSSAVRVRH